MLAFWLSSVRGLLLSPYRLVCPTSKKSRGIRSGDVEDTESCT